MTAFEVFLVVLPALMFAYAYIGYPAILAVLSIGRRRAPLPPEPPVWPRVSISIPVFNEEHQIRGLIESLLAVEYPADRIQILVISDCSSDATDEIVASWSNRGIELLRAPQRRGKTAAEQLAHPLLRGEIIVNTDASIRIHKDAVKNLVRAFADPSVGVASGRDVSVGDRILEGNVGESGYVGYEMWVRSLETRLGGIVGASGSLYAIRAHLHRTPLPEELSRDFASALIAQLHGYRAVSVDSAICIVPRTTSLLREYRRKIRTMARGLDTLWYHRRLLNPVAYPGFAFKLISHKLTRWLVYPLLPVALFALAHLALSSRVAALTLLSGAVMTVLGTIGMLWPSNRAVPRLFAVPGFVLSANLAGLLAWNQMISRERTATWEPTRRPT